jgi:hypothetical protein
VRKGDDFTTSIVPTVKKLRSLNLPKPLGPPRPVAGHLYLLLNLHNFDALWTTCLLDVTLTCESNLQYGEYKRNITCSIQNVEMSGPPLTANRNSGERALPAISRNDLSEVMRVDVEPLVVRTVTTEI